MGAFAAARAVGPAGAVTGLDVSERMVALSASRAAAGGVDNATFGRRDMEATGADDGAFDAVTCAFGLMFAAERAAAFAEIARVTAPGGRVSVCVWGRRAACGFAEVFPIVDAHVDSEVCPLFFSLGVPGALGRRSRAPAWWTSSRRAFRSRSRGPRRTRRAGRCWRVARSRWPGGDSHPRRARSCAREYLASLEPFRRGDRYDVAAEVMFATARKPR